VPDATVRENILLHSGDRYGETPLVESKERLRALGVFPEVDLSTTVVDGHDDRVIVTFDFTPVSPDSPPPPPPPPRG
jgi:outer membrane protein assembly factor BamA